MSLRVIEPGLMTTVQDLGRPGYQHLGIPVGGALDPVGLSAANALVGNAPGTAALEAAYLGPTLLAETDDVRLGLVGARAAIDILPEPGATQGRRIETMRSVTLRRGEAIRIGALTGGAVLYVAVEGGFAIDPVLGSRSTYLRGRIGGWQGRALAHADVLPLNRGRSLGGDTQFEGLDLSPPPCIRLIAGPQSDHFADSELAAFFAGEYTIAGADRMAMRLAGPTIHHRHGFDIVSDAIAPGSIQVPGDGQPIVLLADRQTTGGYPKIATVISADLPALGRLAVGATIRFEPVSIPAAEAARRELFSLIDSFPSKVVGLDQTDLGGKLTDCNLISGVIIAAA
jgi:biotin-dependent carboxylase-like uncharacterized protein